jgi:1-deoxy-D-xylulose 5-phosphate reductoisomerase
MRTPISHTLAWPQRMPVTLPRLDLAALARLEFFAPDPVRFPALRLARGFPILAITGPRQSGKTTLAHTLFTDRA